MLFSLKKLTMSGNGGHHHGMRESKGRTLQKMWSARGGPFSKHTQAH